MGDVGNRDGYAYGEWGIYGKSLYLPLHFAVNLKLFFIKMYKIKVLFIHQFMTIQFDPQFVEMFLFEGIHWSSNCQDETTLLSMSDNWPLCSIVTSLLNVSSISFSTLFSQVHLLCLLLFCSGDSEVISSALWISDSKHSPRVTSSMSFFHLPPWHPNS